MGREIRMVPLNWEHPQEKRHNGETHYKPMFDELYSQAVAEWKAKFSEWEAGKRESYFDAADYPEGIEFWEWDGMPPEREMYRTYADQEATWVQVYETVSEGTPVTPPFATREELIEYLVKNGDFWDQSRGDGPWERESAEAFCKLGWAPSAAFSPVAGMIESRDVAAAFAGNAGSADAKPESTAPTVKRYRSRRIRLSDRVFHINRPERLGTVYELRASGRISVHWDDEAAKCPGLKRDPMRHENCGHCKKNLRHYRANSLGVKRP